MNADQSTMPDLDLLLQRYWGFAAFRNLQREIITDAVAGHHVLAILPTGAGKSLCYQLAGLARGGLTLVISPLIALMRDQVTALNDRGMSATFVNSSLPRAEQERRLWEVSRGQHRFLYLSPERTLTEALLASASAFDIRLIAIDEAHCISQWGFDFRPAYRLLRQLREHLLHVPVLALTATATPEVQDDIVAQLGLSDARRWVGSFARPNLRYAVLYEDDRFAALQRVLRGVLKLGTAGSAIVYARSRQSTEDLATRLTHAGLEAIAYHAGLGADQRSRIQTDWMQDIPRIVVATNAFGMGIDKPDVRAVVHYHLPAAVESYYQEAGRAGRDGLTAFAVLLFHASDASFLQARLRARTLTWAQLKDGLTQFYAHFRVSGSSTERDLSASHPYAPRTLADKVGLSEDQLAEMLRLIEQRELITLRDATPSAPDASPRLRWTAPAAEILRLAERHPQHSPVVHWLLRHHRPVEGWQPLKLKEGAASLQLSADVLLVRLRSLEALGYLQVFAAESGPRLSFVQPKPALRPETLGWAELDALQRRRAGRLASTLAYATATDRCRQQLLLEYFGETGAKRCGVCDVCQGRHDRTAAGADLPDATDALDAALLAAVAAAPLSFTELLAAHGVGQAPPALRVARIRALIDQGQLALTRQHLIQRA